MSQKYECWNCDAVFKIKNFNEETFQEQYEIYYCPYCGGDIDVPDNEDNIEEDE